MIIFPLVSGIPVYADGSVDGSFTVDDTLPPDTTPPATVSNLAVVGVSTYSVKLKWTAPGNDGNSGTATVYDVRFSTTPITNEMEWINSNLVYAVPGPKPPGSIEILTVNGLLPLTTYYFALKTADESYNWSGLSNCVSTKTLIAHLEWEEDEDEGDEVVPTPTIVVPTPTPDLSPVHFDIKGCKGVIYLNLDSNGALVQTWIITLNDGMLELVLEKGTRLLDSWGKPVSVIILRCAEPFGETPQDFEFNAIYDFQPACTINPSVQIKMRYNRDNLNADQNEEDIYIAYYNQNQGNWIPFACTRDADNQFISTSSTHFSYFCLLVPKSEMAIVPSDYESTLQLDIQDLTLSSDVIEQGESLLINVHVINIGDTDGSFLVPLIYNGITLENRIVTLAAKEEKIETFSIVLNEEGTHIVGVGSLSATVTVRTVGTLGGFDFSWLRLPIFWIALVSLIIVLILVIRTRRNKDKTISRQI
jgi:hypothetical protein